MRLSLLPVAAAILFAGGLPPVLPPRGSAGPPSPKRLPASDTERLRHRLATIVDGVPWTSESDFPFTIFVIPRGATPPPTRDDVRERIAPVYRQRPETLPLADRTVEVTTVDDVLQPRLRPLPDWTDAERDTARRLRALRDVLIDEVHGAQVFRIGPFDPFQGLSGDIDVFFMGASDEGDLVGVSTVSIET